MGFFSQSFFKLSSLSKGSNRRKSDDDQGSTNRVGSSRRVGSGDNFCSLCNLNRGRNPKNGTVVSVRGNVTGNDKIIAGSDAGVRPSSNHYRGSPTKERSSIGLHIGKDKFIVNSS